MIPQPFAAGGNQSYPEFWAVTGGLWYPRYFTLTGTVTTFDLDDTDEGQEKVVRFKMKVQVSLHRPHPTAPQFGWILDKLRIQQRDAIQHTRFARTRRLWL
jgi:hypothetical protein